MPGILVGRTGQTLASGVYVLRVLTFIQTIAGTLADVSLERLEPCVSTRSGSRAVLRGRGRVNRLPLPGV